MTEAHPRVISRFGFANLDGRVRCNAPDARHAVFTNRAGKWQVTIHTPDGTVIARSEFRRKRDAVQDARIALGLRRANTRARSSDH